MCGIDRVNFFAGHNIAECRQKGIDLEHRHRDPRRQHEDLGPLHGLTVVVETVGPEVYTGRAAAGGP